MTSSEDLTVLVVAYNHAQFIVECLDSIRGQVGQLPHVFIADDCSTDETDHVIKDYLREWPDFASYYPNKVNMGLTKTLNALLARVRTPFVTYISADDLMLPGRLEQQTQLMRETCAVLSYTDAIVIDAKSDQIGLSSAEFPWPPESERTERTFDLLLDTNWIPAASFMMRTKELVDSGGYEEEIFYEDHELLVRLAKNYPFAYLEEPLVAVRRLETSLGTTGFRSKSPRFIKALDHTLRHYSDAEPTLRQQSMTKRWELAKRSITTEMPRGTSLRMLWEARHGAGSWGGRALHLGRWVASLPTSLRAGRTAGQNQ